MMRWEHLDEAIVQSLECAKGSGEVDSRFKFEKFQLQEFRVLIC